MLRDSGIGQSEQLGHLAEAKLALAERQQQAEALLVGERLGDIQQVLHVVISSIDETLGRQEARVNCRD